MAHNFAVLFFLLIFAHCLADYTLQGDFLSQAKNRNTSIGKTFWPHALFAHSMIHVGFVLTLTGSVALAVAEMVIHGLTDWLKCENKISLNQDQAVHVGCKFVWALLTIRGI